MSGRLAAARSVYSSYNNKRSKGCMLYVIVILVITIIIFACESRSDKDIKDAEEFIKQTEYKYYTNMDSVNKAQIKHIDSLNKYLIDR